MVVMSITGFKPPSLYQRTEKASMTKHGLLAWLGGVICLLATIALSSGTAYALTCSGTGTEADPYLISSSTHLGEISSEVKANTNLDHKYFRQTGNIVFEHNESFTAIGTSIGSRYFTGNYDGGNYTISGISINRSDTDCQGLFGYVGSSGTIKNVRLVDSVITGKNYVGSIVGKNDGIVENCSCSNTAITGTNYVGGIVGQNIFKAVVAKGANSSTVTGTQYVGGVVGHNNNGTVKNCYNRGNINGDSYVGGVAGFKLLGTMQNCYNTGIISGTTFVGGVLGENNGDGFTNNYFLQTDTINAGLPGIGSPAGNTGAEQRTAAAMQADAFAYNLNTTGTIKVNSGVWSRNPAVNDGYPIMADADNRAIYKVNFINDADVYSIDYSGFTATVSLPSDPSQAGYGFGGWYTGLGGTGTALTTDTPITSDLTVNAHWYQDAANLPAFELVGAELRNDSPEGLRFITRLYKNEFFASNRITEYGTVILPQALIGAGKTLSLTTVPSNYDHVLKPDSAIVIIPAVHIYTQNDDYVVYTGVLTNIPVTREEEGITAIAYVKYRDDNDREQIIYSASFTRSIKEVRTLP